MNRFTIETSNIENSSSTMHNIASSVMSLADEIKAANTENKYNIDFEKPKRIIWASVYNSSEKITSAGEILTTTVEAHTDFQNANTFSKYVETTDISSIPTLAVTAGAAGATLQASSSPASGSSSYSSNSGYSNYSSGSYSSGSSSTPVNADMASDTGSYVSTGSSTAFEKAAEGSLLIETVAFANLTGKSVLKSHKYEDEDKTKPKAEYIYEYNKSSKESLIDFDYDDDSGLAKVDDMYAIRCDEAYGKVGDIIVIETKDGLRYECLIMENVETIEDEVSGIEFYTNLPDKVTKITANLPNPDLNITKIDNYGEYDKFKDLKLTLPSNKAVDTNLASLDTGATQSTPEVPKSSSSDQVIESTNSEARSSNTVLSLLTEDRQTLVELREKMLSSKDQG